MLTTQAVFDRYQQIRNRLPAVTTQEATRDIESLVDIADEVSVFVFDAFGVLNVGETAIPGANDRLCELRARGCHLRILTNAASYDHRGAVEKFNRLGLSVLPDEIVTSRQAAINDLAPRVWGVVAAPEDTFGDINERLVRLGDNPAHYDDIDGVLLLSSSGWHEDRQQLLKDSLLSHPKPVVVANPDLVAPRDDGFSLEPGHFAHLLMDAGVESVRFFGKPFTEVYELIESSLPPVAPADIVMCGDTLHTDILGAAARGWRTVLVTQDGLFAGHDTQVYSDSSGLHPDWRLPRI